MPRSSQSASDISVVAAAISPTPFMSAFSLPMETIIAPEIIPDFGGHTFVGQFPQESRPVGGRPRSKSDFGSRRS